MGNNILIIGPAKTGTTVISKTIQKSIKNANYFLEPKEIIFFNDGKFINNNNTNVVKIIFEHWNKKPRLRYKIIKNKTKIKFNKIVCIKRDPRDEIISRLFYIIFIYCKKYGKDVKKLKDWINIIKEKELNPESISFIGLANKYNKLFNTSFNYEYNIHNLRKYYKFLNNNKKNIFILQYEEFMQNKIQKLEKYLNFKLSKNRDVGNLSRTNRSGSFNNWKRFFLKDDVDYFKVKFGWFFKEYGYEDWELENVDHLNPSHGSEYISKLILNK